MICDTTTAVIARSASDEAIQDSHRLRGPWIASLALAMTEITTSVIPGRALARTRNLAPHTSRLRIAPACGPSGATAINKQEDTL
jgi:hypothetical protein